MVVIRAKHGKQPLASRPAIIPDMPIFGSDGAFVGIVHRVAGVRIVVAHEGVSDADQHYIPLSWVASVTDRVTLDCPAADARPQSATQIAHLQEKTGRTVGPFLWGGIGVLAVLLLYLGSNLLPRGAPAAADNSVDPVPTPSATTVEALTPDPTPTPAPTPTAPPATPEASPQSIAEFLNSDAPAPQRFSLDALGFAPGSASLSGDAEKAVDGIAQVMRDHLNTKIKLAILPGGGGVALRRIAVIRDALVGRGVADYRITTGPARGRTGASKAGVEIVVLAK